MTPARLALALLTAVQLAVVPDTVQAAPKVVGAILAVVDGEPITLWQVRKHVEPTLQAQRANTRSWQWPDAARSVLRDAVEREIDARLFAAAARSMGIIVERARIDAQLAQAVSQSGRSVDQYLAELHASGWSEAALREELRLQILEWDVLRRAWSDSHDTKVPSGDQWFEWRRTWLAERRAAACIELRIPNAP